MWQACPLRVLREELHWDHGGLVNILCYFYIHKWVSQGYVEYPHGTYEQWCCARCGSRSKITKVKAPFWADMKAPPPREPAPPDPKSIKLVVPNFVDLGFHRIYVDLISPEEMFEEADCEEDDYIPEGLWNSDIDTIFLLDNMSWKQTRYYLCHELVHAMLDCMDSMEIGP
jgi:hypothetical protein